MGGSSGDGHAATPAWDYEVVTIVVVIGTSLLAFGLESVHHDNLTYFTLQYHINARGVSPTACPSDTLSSSPAPSSPCSACGFNAAIRS